MPAPGVRIGSLEGTRGRIIDLLRRSDMTANEIAARLGMTHNSVRSHLAALEREGLVRARGFRPSGRRPAATRGSVPQQPGRGAR